LRQFELITLLCQYEGKVRVQSIAHPQETHIPQVDQSIQEMEEQWSCYVISLQLNHDESSAYCGGWAETNQEKQTGKIKN
jgi:hypothetical protein